MEYLFCGQVSVSARKTSTLFFVFSRRIAARNIFAVKLRAPPVFAEFEYGPPFLFVCGMDAFDL